MNDRPMAIQHHRNHLRFGWQVGMIIVVVIAVFAFLGWSAVRRDASSLLNPEAIRELLVLAAVLIVVLVALVGVYSVMVDFVFWEGWVHGLPDPRDLFPPSPEKDSPHRHYLVYLDGIHQSEENHPPRVSEFLQILEQSIDHDSLLVKGIEAYTITPVGLRSTPFAHWFWHRLFALQEHHSNGFVRFLCAFCVQANNVIKVGISSDRRYGPVMNYELALKIARRLNALGFHPSRAARVVLVGYSGGGEMAIGTAAMLQKLCHVPVQVITVCGVFSGNGDLETLDHVAMVVGEKDPVAAFGRIAYPGRSPLLPLSNWNRWLRHGRLHRYVIPSMNHNGNAGPFSAAYRTRVVEEICRELATTATL